MLYICKMNNKTTKVNVSKSVNIDADKTVIKMLDKIRDIETVDGVSRSKMIRILIKERFQKNFKK